MSSTKTTDDGRDELTAFRMPERLSQRLEETVEREGFDSRSAAIRAFIRDGVRDSELVEEVDHS